MKKFLTVLATLTTAALTTALLTVPASAQSAMTMGHSGAFHALGAPTSGKAILDSSGGKTVLKLEGLKTEPGPGLQVWLYVGKSPAKGTPDVAIVKGKYLKVGELKTFSGDFSFPVPAGTKIGDYKSVVLWCANVKTAFGSAPLN